MTSISFDNPLLLLSIIPLLLLVFIPYAVAIRKTNSDKNVRTSLVLHVIMAFAVALALGGTVLTTVITKTEVFVLADVSASSEKNLDTVDGYISELKDKLPINSKMGIVTFGKDYKLHTPLGESISSVRNSGVDDSATDIVSAMQYVGGLFSDNSIKRIVLITDGKQTSPEASGELVTVIEQLYARGVKIDAVYLDNNIDKSAREVQISDVDFTEKTYLGHSVSADVLVQSSYETEAIVSLERDGEKIRSLAVKLTPGYNIVNFNLPTDAEGSFDYTVSVSSDEDESAKNNSQSFTQTVASSVRVLLISTDSADLERARELYGEGAIIDAYINKNDVPTSLEAICAYDEIILSDVDVRNIKNFTAFVDSVDTAVSVFGKSLLTFGDTKIQNKTDDVLHELEDMLPVRFGNNDQDTKLFTIVIDTSRSMQLSSKLIMARSAAKQLISLLAPEDYVAIVSFSGTVSVAQTPIQAKNYGKLCDVIDSLAPTQGTVIGAALDEAANIMLSLPYDKKQVMLISDGVSYSNEVDNPIEIATDLFAANISVSALCTAEPRGVSAMQNIARAGGGEYYYVLHEEELEELILNDIADEITESIIESENGIEVNVNKAYDKSLIGVQSLPDIYGYVYAKPKASATTVLTTKYYKASGGSVDVPLYAYWSYGNGTVSSFTSSLSGEWTSAWQTGDGNAFLENVTALATPSERNDIPLDIAVSYDGISAGITVTPVKVKSGAVLTLTVTYPDGSEEILNPTFNLTGWSHDFAARDVGGYKILVDYAYGDVSYQSESYFNISYSPEYNSFEVFDPSALYMAVRNRGTVSTDSLPSLENDDGDIAKYTLSLVGPLMILALSLYVVDVIIRKLKWRDILSLFGKGRERREK